MAIYDPSDVCFNPNVLHTDSKQYLGDMIVNTNSLAGGIAQTLTTARKFGPDASGVYNKYHNRNHTDYFGVVVH